MDMDMHNMHMYMVCMCTVLYKDHFFINRTPISHKRMHT